VLEHHLTRGKPFYRPSKFHNYIKLQQNYLFRTYFGKEEPTEQARTTQRLIAPLLLLN